MSSPEDASATPVNENDASISDVNTDVIKRAFRDFFEVSDGPDGEIIVSPRSSNETTEETRQP
jgi:hypothetical protein